MSLGIGEFYPKLNKKGKDEGTATVTSESSMGCSSEKESLTQSYSSSADNDIEMQTSSTGSSANIDGVNQNEAVTDCKSTDHEDKENIAAVPSGSNNAVEEAGPSGSTQGQEASFSDPKPGSAKSTIDAETDCKSTNHEEKENVPAVPCDTNSAVEEAAPSQSMQVQEASLSDPKPSSSSSTIADSEAPSCSTFNK